MKTDFIFEPVPNKEAVAFIAGKPVVSQRVFKNLLPELKARAFTVSGVEAFGVLQTVRDRLSALPAGGDWNAIKRDIASDLGPWFVDQDADADEQEKQYAAAESKAELLLRTHGNQAYASASWQVLDRQRDALPYWQYLTMGDGHVREEHAALNGLTLPADSPFWTEHYPPWDWGCRCQVAAITREEYADIQAADADRAPDQQLAPTGAALAQIEQSNRLVRGPNQIFNLTPPSQRADGGGYRFNPRDLTLTAEQLKGRYDAETWNEFEQWAKQVDVSADADGGKAAPLWDWMNGSAVKARAAAQAYPGEGGVLASVDTLTLNRHADAVQRAAAALDQAGLPAPVYPVAVRESKLPLTVSGNTVPDGRGYIVNLNPAAKNPEETFVHEWAHALKRMMPEKRREDLVAFLKSTDNYLQLKKRPDGNYWRGDDELLARAFTQYVAETAGHDALQSNMFLSALNNRHIYWSGADVEVIIKKFRGMFK